MANLGPLAAGAGVVTTFQGVKYCPQFLMFSLAAMPQAVKVTVDNVGVICDLDADGIAIASSMRGYYGLATDVVIPLATGKIDNLNLTIEITNSGAGTPSVYAVSQRFAIPGVDAAYIQSIKQYCVAGSGVEFTKFAVLGLPNAAAADPIIINHTDGMQESSFRDELLFRKKFISAQSATLKYNYLVLNFDQKVSSVNFTPAAAQTAYVFRFAPVGSVSTVV